MRAGGHVDRRAVGCLQPASGAVLRRRRRKKTKLSQAYVVSDEPVRRLNDVTFDQLTSFIAAARAAPAVTNFASTLLMSDSIGIRHRAVAACGRNDVGGTIRERKPCRGVGGARVGGRILYVTRTRHEHLFERNLARYCVGV